MCGSATQRAAEAAMAASTALPPSRSTLSATSVAKGCEVAAMPVPAIAAERRGAWKFRMFLPRCRRLEGALPALHAAAPHEAGAREFFVVICHDAPTGGPDRVRGCAEALARRYSRQQNDEVGHGRCLCLRRSAHADRTTCGSARPSATR